MVDQCYSWLQLSFIQQAKDSTPSRHKGEPTPKGRPQSVLASSFYKFISSPRPLSLPYANWDGQKVTCLFHLKFSLRSMDFPLLHFHELFSFFVF